MQTSMAVKTFIIVALISLVVIAGFNYYVDANCDYSCQEISLAKKTTNSYYRRAQAAIANPDAQQIMIGSSRVETTSPIFLENITGKKTLNLAVAGADFVTRKILTELAMQNAKIQTVYWYADYLEVSGGADESKFKDVAAFAKYFPQEPFKSDLASALKLFNYKTFEASLYKLLKSQPYKPNLGVAEDIDNQACLDESFAGTRSQNKFQADLQSNYETYAKHILTRFNPEKWIEFADFINAISKMGVKVILIMTPYHPVFLDRLKNEKPQIYADHLMWAKKVHALASEGKVVVVDIFSNGIPGDDGSVRYWNDGVHFNCRSAALILGKIE